ncbi:MAG: hypothetical protein VX278_05780 [Myxococcota bacterium]|nr:hypothetical protein [Myxococcota bacterium]
MYQVEAKDKELYDAGWLSITGLMKAYRAKDPRLAEYAIKLCIIDPAPVVSSELPEGSIQYNDFRVKYHNDAVDPNVLHQIKPSFSSRFPHQETRKKKAELFTERFDELLKNPSCVPERLKLGEFLLFLYEEKAVFAQEQLVAIMKDIPLKWGPWQAFKYILKRGLMDQKWSLYAVLYDRWTKLSPELFSTKTWKIMRYSFPKTLLPMDMKDVNWNNAGLFKSRSKVNEVTTESYLFLEKMFAKQHIRQWSVLSEETKEDILIEILLQLRSFPTRYTRNFSKGLWVKWAEELSWTSRSAPLMRLFLDAKDPKTSDWALNKLINHHRSTLVNLSPSWIVEKGTDKRSPNSIKKFIVHWFLDPITDIPKADFISQNLHKVILAFIDLNTDNNAAYGSRALAYTCDFIRQFMYEMAPHISLDKVIWMLRSRNTSIHELGLWLLFPEGEKKSPFAEQMDLDFWTGFLGDARLHDYAVKAIERNFSKNSLHKEWIRNRLYARDERVRELAMSYIEEGRHAHGIDWFDVYLENLFEYPAGQRVANTLSAWAWNALSKKDAQGNALSQRFSGLHYRRLLLHRDKKLAQVAFSAYQNEQILPEQVPVGFLRSLISNQEYKTREWSPYVEIDSYKQVCSSLSRELKTFAQTTLSNREDCTIEHLGAKWVLKHRNGRREYAFVAELFQSSFPIYQLGLLSSKKDEPSLSPTNEQIRTSIQTVFKLIDEEWNQKSSVCIFWRTFLKNRLQRYRDHHQLEPLAQECIIPPELFPFDWFKEQIGSQEVQKRTFAIHIAELYLADWIQKEETFGFIELGELLFSPHNDVADFILRCIENPSSKHSFINTRAPDFTPEDLFSYVFSENPVSRKRGMQLIQSDPEAFAQPDKLILLTQSSDPFVRASIVSIMWDVAQIPIVTPDWSVYEDSMVPGNSNKPKQNRVRTARINPRSGEPIGREKYLGKGTPKDLTPNLSDYQSLADFAQRELFRIPKRPPKQKKRKKSDIRLPGWRTKQFLLEAFRDLALVDRNFAEVMIPIFKELAFYKGIIVRDMALSALVRLEKQYEDAPMPQLTFLDEMTVTPASKEQ